MADMLPDDDPRLTRVERRAAEWAALTAERDQLRAEVERLRTDKERIDWLTQHGATIYTRRGEAIYERRGYATVRSAIDDARTAPL